MTVRRRWCYEEEGIKESAHGLESRYRKKNKATERKRGINRNRKAEKDVMFK